MEKLAERIEMLPGEEKVFSLGKLELTNKRVAYASAGGGTKEIGAAMVKDIDSVMLRSKRPSLSLLIWGIILVIVDILLIRIRMRIMGNGIGLILIGIIMIILFFLLKRKVLVLTVTGRDWLILGKRAIGRRADIEEFINKFFAVKNAINYPQETGKLE